MLIVIFNFQSSVSYLTVFSGADVRKEGAPLGVFRYPSYVQDIMGYVKECLKAM